MNLVPNRVLNQKTAKYVLVGVAVIALSSCQTLRKIGPEATIVDAKLEVPIPSTWVEPAPNALPNSNWVESFQDQKLVELVDTALVKNPGLTLFKPINSWLCQKAILLHSHGPFG